MFVRGKDDNFGIRYSVTVMFRFRFLTVVDSRLLCCYLGLRITTSLLFVITVSVIVAIWFCYCLPNEMSNCLEENLTVKQMYFKFI